jgi:hypothetical protein
MMRFDDQMRLGGVKPFEGTDYLSSVFAVVKVRFNTLALHQHSVLSQRTRTKT